MKKSVRDIMASVSMAPVSGLRDPAGNAVAFDRLPDEMNDMKIRDEKVNRSLPRASTPPHFTCFID